MKTALKISVIVTGSLLTLAFSSCAKSKCGYKPKTPQAATTAKVKPYPLDTCMVIGAKLSSTPKTYTRVYKGQEVKFCCVSCIKAFEANPNIYLAKIE